MVTSYDLIVIGSGPGGQNAAIQAAKFGKKVLVIEKQRELGGACLHHGTIPSKTLRASAFELSTLQASAGHLEGALDAGEKMTRLRDHLSQVIASHVQVNTQQLEHYKIQRAHGHARFVTPHELEIIHPDSTKEAVHGEKVVIASGSRPRQPENITLDHEQILDSDSLLALDYLPEKLTILGSGIIACEYASIFAALGVQVTMIDRHPTPLGFLDADLSETFVRSIESFSGVFLGQETIASITTDDFLGVTTTLESGKVIVSDKILIALGRVPNVESLGLDNAGVKLSPRGTILVNDAYRTSQANIAAVGDVIGPPALASYSMDQGRRAVTNFFGEDTGSCTDLIPMGIFTIPEIACVGLSEKNAHKRAQESGESFLVGHSQFGEIARGNISTHGHGHGMLKLISDAQGEKLLGVGISGEGAIELVHIGQMALRCHATIRDLVETVFNFPTLAEAYRVAALDILRQRPDQRAKQAA